jgi:hypothetical protein
VHDGIHLENAGKPSATICTDIFEHTAKAMSEMWGAKDYPIIYTKHPIASLTREQLRQRAEEMMPQTISILTGLYR